MIINLEALKVKLEEVGKQKYFPEYFMADDERRADLHEYFCELLGERHDDLPDISSEYCERELDMGYESSEEFTDYGDRY